MIVRLFNFYYFLYVFLAVGVFVALYFVLRNKDKKTIYNVIRAILGVNLGLHFAKLLFPPYNANLPGSIRKVTFENICAVSTLVDLFVFTSKKEGILKDYFWFISLCGGIGALFVPTEAFGKFAFSFDVMRFYFCHMILLVVPLLIVATGLWYPDYRKAPLIPLMFLAVETLIFVNEIILIKIGFVSSNLAEFLDPTIRNSSMIFGPIPALGKFNVLAEIFTPPIFTKNIFGIPGVGDFYWPIVWLIIPSFVYVTPAYLILTLPYKRKRAVLADSSEEPAATTGAAE